ncbi:DUF563 domain-containing protein [Beijerinckia sp. L45]|uniref:glycosyltransferase family 61 protein n=1 Tax=Beijerinckia sp. L45 TaxID=1641855 RepID=UPI00131AC7D5|nr:glycosyltransferase family 61 protein [Beijerinckia sp. L45]
MFQPTGFDESDDAARRAPTGSILRWRKIKCGPLVFVLTDWSLRLRGVRIVPSSSVATAFIKPAPALSYERRPPRIFNVTPVLARAQAARFAASPETPPAGGLALFTDATISASGVVLTADGRVIGESLLNSQEWSAFGVFVRAAPDAPLQMKALPLTIQKRLSACPHVMMKQTFDANYGHWLIECLPRLAAAAAHFDLSACKFVVADRHGAMQQIYIDSLVALGLRPEQIVSIGYTPVHVDMLVYPLPITTHPWVKSPGVATFLEIMAARIARPEVTAPRRIYVSRKRGGMRRLINEAAVIAIVERYGFTVVYPETMAFSAQVATFRDAEIVVGNYGANLSNIVFAPRGVTLFALTTEAMQDDFFWDLMDHKAGAYVSLHGKATTAAPNQNSDFTIDIARFEQILGPLISELGARETTAAVRRCDR